MQRKLLFSPFATLCSIIVAFFVSVTGSPAQPQQNLSLCEYRITVADDVGCNIPLKTSWSSGAQDSTVLFFVFSYQVQIPDPTNCPPAPTFDWCSVDGGITKIQLGQPAQQVYVDGCCIRVAVRVDSEGYILILISPCI